MLLKDTAFQLVNRILPGTFEDVIEAYQIINDEGWADELKERQRYELDKYIEMGVVVTLPVFYFGWT